MGQKQHLRCAGRHSRSPDCAAIERVKILFEKAQIVTKYHFGAS